LRCVSVWWCHICLGEL